MTTIITSCTSTRTEEPLAKVGDLQSGHTMESALQEWLATLSVHSHKTTPRKLYRGQGFLTLSNVMRNHKITNSYIVTGGQGLIHVDEEIVPYDFTADKHVHPNIWEKVTAEPFMQAGWWSLICQARKDDPNPVATLIAKAKEPSEIVISCPKIFLRYIAADILSAPQDKMHCVRILLSASSLGSIPQQLRPYIVSYDRSALNHIPGNRNDASHRALQLFLEGFQKDPSLKEQPPYMQKAAIFGQAEQREKLQSIDIEEILNERLDLLELDPDSAYRQLYKERGPIGGRLRFKGAFMAKKGETLEGAEADKDAFDALSHLGLTAKGNLSSLQDDRAVQLGLVFAAALREKMPEAHFRAGDFSSWVEHYCRTKKEEVPEVVSSPLKASYFLKTHHPLLGMTPQGKGYVLTSRNGG